MIARIKLAVLLLASLGSLPALAATAFDFSYSGRLTEADSGKPVDGPVALSLSFYHQASGGNPVLTITSGLGSVTLQDGVFQFNLSLSGADYHTVFSDVSQPVFVEITDLTHAATQPYERQQVGMVPFAAKIPVDGRTLVYNSDGQLTAVAQNGSGSSGVAAGNLVALDNSAKLPAIDGSQLTNVTASTVGGQAAAVVATAATKVAAATSSIAAGTIAIRDSSGGFSAGYVTSPTVNLTSGAHQVTLQAPSGLASDVVYTLPATASAGSFLTTNAGGTLAWAAVPGGGLAKTGDTMTGALALPANGLVIGTSQLVAASGNLGIGTTAPTRLLDIAGMATHAGTGTASQLSVRGPTDSGNKLNIGYDTTGNFGYIESVNEFTYWENTILQPTSGNVGIATTSPALRLQVNGITGAPGTSGSAPAAGTLRLSAGTNAALDFGNFNSPPWGAWIQSSRYDDMGQQWPLTLQPNGANVGIGTSNPDARLTVAGEVHATAGGFRFPDGTLMTSAVAVGGGGTSTTGALQFAADSGSSGTGDINFTTRGSSRIHVDNSGNVGINTATPVAQLDVNGFVSSLGPGNGFVVLQPGASSSTGYTPAYGLGWSTLGHTQLSGWNGLSMVSRDGQLYLDIAGNLGVGTTAPAFALDVVGDTRTSGCFRTGAGAGSTLGGSCVSDRRFKRDIEPVTGALARLTAVRPVQYRFRTEDFPERHFSDQPELGFIAQELAAVYPRLVTQGKDGYFRVNYGLDLHIETIAAVRELKQLHDRDVAALQAKAATLQEENRVLRSQVEAQQAYLCAKFADAPGCAP